MNQLFHNVTLIDGGREFRGFLAFTPPFITAVGAGDPPPALLAEADHATDLGGDFLIPGVIDTHVHFRDSGADPACTNFATESRAALAGGVTSVFDMPNTIPATVTGHDLEVKAAHAARTSAVNYAFFIGASPDHLDSLDSADYSRVPGIKLFMGPSTGSLMVKDPETLRRVFASRGDIPVAVHAEDGEILEQNMERILHSIPEGSPVPISLHPQVRSAEACLKATRQAMALARTNDTRLHLLHVSTAAEARLLSPGFDLKSKRTTAETAPHYLLFDSSAYDRLGAKVKCNPAIKSADDRLALIDALADGRIDTIATDHAPHPARLKQGDLLKAASGMPGVEFSLTLMLELTETYPQLSRPRIVAAMTQNPAEIYHIDRRGRLIPGYYADLVIVRREAQATPVDSASIRSFCGWSPYVGFNTRYRVVRTIVNGDTPPMPLRFTH